MKLRIFFFITFLIMAVIALIIIILASGNLIDEQTFGKIGIALLLTSLVCLYLALRGNIPEEDNTKEDRQKGKKKSRIICEALALDNNKSIGFIDYLTEQIICNGYQSIEYRADAKNVGFHEYYRIYPDENSVRMIVILCGKGISENIIEQCILDQENIYRDNDAVNNTNRKNMIMILIPDRYDKSIESCIEDGTIIDYETSIITVAIDADKRQAFISPKDYTGTKKWNESVKELKRIIPIIQKKS